MNFSQSYTYFNDLQVTLDHISGLEKLKYKAILITGATGTVGSYIADTLFLLNEKYDYRMKIILAVRNINRINKLYPEGSNGLEVVHYDLGETIGFNLPVDYIIHVAGNAHPAAFNSDPVGTIINSINSTKRLLDYGNEKGAKRFLYISSGEVYGLGDVRLDAFKEDYLGTLDLTSPRSCYPESKRATENLCASYSSQYGLETVSVRLCHTYGPTISPTDNRAQVQFIRNALAHHNIELKSAGTQLRSYNYVADAVAGILTVLLKGISGEAYNIANPDVIITVAGLAKVIAAYERQNVVFADPCAVDIANRSPIAKQVLDTTKLESLGWEAAFSLEEGIAHTLQILHESKNSSNI